MVCTTVREVYRQSVTSSSFQYKNIPSRSTLVNTIYPNPQRLIASAVFSGSCGSSGGGALEVLTEQNRQPRVHVSPMSFPTFFSTPSRISREVTHHDRRRRTPLALLCCHTFFTTTPAVSDIGASRFLADGVQSKSTQILLDFVKRFAGWDLGLQVGR